MRRTKVKGVVIALMVVTTSGCYSVNNEETLIDVKLDGYSMSNYVALDQNPGQRACVEGVLKVDTAGVYFPLQPIESDGVISVSFSRINTDLTKEFVSKVRGKRGKRSVVCGDVRETTPFENCETNFCRCYELGNSTLVHPSR